MTPGSRLKTADLPLAVVIGAGAMGLEIGRKLGESARLLLVDRDSEHVLATASRMRTEGFEVNSFACDITDEAAVAELGSHVRSVGPMRILAHVVGLSPSAGNPQLILDVDLIGAARIERALVGTCEPGSAAVFISSLAAHGARPEPHVAELLADPLRNDLFTRLTKELGEELDAGIAYSLAKWGLNHMCRARSSAWGERGARIVSISPGLIASPMGEQEFAHQPVKYRMLEKTPLKRLGTMREIADAVAFLASPCASFITGVDLLIDGGVSAAMATDPSSSR